MPYYTYGSTANFLFLESTVLIHVYIRIYLYNIYIIESVDSISKDERGFPLT